VIPPPKPPLPGERVVVVSPHSDDGVLSVGAVMSSWARHGARVELLTVLALDPASTAPAGGWDRRGGFDVEGEAARARRSEDARACAILGVTPRWLPFGSVDYDRHGDERSVGDAAAEAIASADRVLLPGFPLSHPDHEWLVRVLITEGGMRARLGFYAEQPYAARTSVLPALPAWLVERTRSASPFATVGRHPRDVLAKWRAIRCYQSQLPLLAMTGLRRGPVAAALSAELVTEWHDWPRI
jgi:LmbE family N-acetylglucosaminyl deacetylase